MDHSPSLQPQGHLSCCFCMPVPHLFVAHHLVRCLSVILSIPHTSPTRYSTNSSHSSAVVCYGSFRCVVPLQLTSATLIHLSVTPCFPAVPFHLPSNTLSTLSHAINFLLHSLGAKKFELLYFTFPFLCCFRSVSLNISV